MEKVVSPTAVKALALEYQKLQKEPLEGFLVSLMTEDNLFVWDVSIFGPPDSLYQGGCFKARMRFPGDYPYSPPTVRFVTSIWHPNVYTNGDLCISILHPPQDDPRSGELPCERWNPTQNVRTILLSVISLLNEPNTSSPANVDASVMYMRWLNSKGQDKEYENVVRKQAEASKIAAEKEGIFVPTTIEDYCIKTSVESVDKSELNDYDLFDCGSDFESADSDDLYDESSFEDNDDSGNSDV